MLKIWSMVGIHNTARSGYRLTCAYRNKHSRKLTRTHLGRRRKRLPPRNCVYRKVPLHCPSTAVNSVLTRHTDLSELSLGSTMRTDFPNPDDILNFTLTIEPDEGMYKGGRFTFSFAINQNFPHDPPKVLCKDKIYHPNIDLEGKVCLNILREDWKPVLNLNAVIVGLQFLFLEPNASDPLNKAAAEDLKMNREGFKRNVRTAMAGGSVKGESFERVLK
jgi:ubiquitin-conjugating enzyme E2 M